MISPKSILVRQWVYRCHRWLSGRCFTKRSTPAWVVTHRGDTLGTLWSTCRQLQWRVSPLPSGCFPLLQCWGGILQIAPHSEHAEVAPSVCLQEETFQLTGNSSACVPWGKSMVLLPGDLKLPLWSCRVFFHSCTAVPKILSNQPT